VIESKFNVRLVTMMEALVVTYFMVHVLEMDVVMNGPVTWVTVFPSLVQLCLWRTLMMSEILELMWKIQLCL
jgi:hypothetical protein